MAMLTTRMAKMPKAPNQACGLESIANNASMIN
jgi:hypothetical protein